MKFSHNHYTISERAPTHVKHRFKLMPLKEGSFMHSHIGCYALLIMSALSLLQVRGTEFETTIRPLLSNACFQCHGPDAAQRKAGLRLDQESEIKSQKDGQWIIDPDQRHQGLLRTHLLKTQKK